ncbi:MAG: LPS assembly lipoprotein LptE [Elusimicrobia bacterium]|nr:LPS assembly lipoprotein LptE [Elusimicrobiota bacterium]
MKKVFLIIAVCVAVLSACAAPYTPAMQILPANVRKVYIRPFINNTTQYGLEDKLTLQVIDELIRDGRLAVVNSEEQANGVITGEISKYILQPLTYDSNNVAEQYKLWVLVTVSFIDKDHNVTLWTEPNLEGIEIYTDVTRPGGRAEEDVRADIWDTLSRAIVKRTVEGFGSVTGVSEKKVPQ